MNLLDKMIEDRIQSKYAEKESQFTETEKILLSRLNKSREYRIMLRDYQQELKERETRLNEREEQINHLEPHNQPRQSFFVRLLRYHPAETYCWLSWHLY